MQSLRALPGVPATPKHPPRLCRGHHASSRSQPPSHMLGISIAQGDDSAACTLSYWRQTALRQTAEAPGPVLGPQVQLALQRWWRSAAGRHAGGASADATAGQPQPGAAQPGEGCPATKGAAVGWAAAEHAAAGGCALSVTLAAQASPSERAAQSASRPSRPGKHKYMLACMPAAGPE